MWATSSRAFASTSRTSWETSFASSSRSGMASASRTRLARRGLATEASSEPLIDPSEAPIPEAFPKTLPYKLYTSIILARSPLLTSTPTPLESTYHAYQSRLHRALSTPFPGEFYFKKGSLLERRFLAQERARNAEAFGEGFEPEEGAERLEDVPSEEDPIQILPREHEADLKGDVKDLNRQGERTLYLLVKANGSGKGSGQAWRFPHWEAGVVQPLHKTLQEGLVSSFGPNMHTWIVGRQPIGFEEAADASKTFYFKGRVLAGRPAVSPASKASISDLAWLTKEEIEQKVDASYWENIHDMLPRV